MSELNPQLAKLRSDYSKMELDENRINKNPILQFEQWLKEAIDTGVIEPNAMTLSTVNTEGKPSSRIVLLRDISDLGFIFYTNYNSRKGKEITENNFAALNFFWPQLERQVRVEGNLEKVSEAISDAYFNSRPHESKVGAWVSNQSEIIKNRKDLEDEFSKSAAQYSGKTVPRPAHWGGYLLKPNTVEFWQGRPNRLHDRIQYILTENKWLISRLAP